MSDYYPYEDQQEHDYINKATVSIVKGRLITKQSFKLIDELLQIGIKLKSEDITYRARKLNTIAQEAYDLIDDFEALSNEYARIMKKRRKENEKSSINYDDDCPYSNALNGGGND